MCCPGVPLCHLPLSILSETLPISAPTKRDPSPPRQGWFSSRLYPPGAGSDTVPLHFSTFAQALTAPPTKRCCGSTATTSRLPWGPASSPSLGSGTLSDVTNGELPISWANKPQLSISLSQPSAPHPTPREAWNSLGQMSREEAMSAYMTEMKLVAQKVGRGCRLLPMPKVSAR